MVPSGTDVKNKYRSFILSVISGAFASVLTTIVIIFVIKIQIGGGESMIIQQINTINKEIHEIKKMQFRHDAIISGLQTKFGLDDIFKDDLSQNEYESYIEEIKAREKALRKQLDEMEKESQRFREQVAPSP